MAIDKKSSQPLYAQLVAYFKRQLREGEWVAHDRLPSERILSEQFDISRLTVRKALGKLAAEGLIYTSAGKGTFVAAPRFRQELPRLTSFSEDMRALGLRPSSVLLEAMALPASEEIAAQLEIEAGTETFLLERLRLANDQVVQHVVEFIRQDFCPGLLDVDWRHRSLFETFSQRYGLNLTKAEQSIVADLATPEEARLLQTSVAGAVIRLRRTTFLDTGVPVSFSKAVYRGDRFAFNVMLYASEEGRPGRL